MLNRLRSWATDLTSRILAREEQLQRLHIWAAGDRALCVEPVDWRAFETPAGKVQRGPCASSLLTVAEVLAHDGDSYLAFTEYPGRAYRARHFQPVRPPVTLEGAANVVSLRKEAA